jgi:hypothetical protein
VPVHAAGDAPCGRSGAGFGSTHRVEVIPRFSSCFPKVWEGLRASLWPTLRTHNCGVCRPTVGIQGALCDAKFFGLHDRKNPANAAMNVYRAADDRSSDAGAFPASIIHGVYHHHRFARFALIAPSSWAHDIGDKRGQSHRTGESYGAQGSNRVHDFPRLGLL